MVGFKQGESEGPDETDDEKCAQGSREKNALPKTGGGVKRPETRKCPPTFWVMASHDGER